MGAKASVPTSATTSAGGGQNPRTRTYSSSTEGGIVGGGVGSAGSGSGSNSNSSSGASATGFNLLRVLPSGLQQHTTPNQSQSDRQRARSLSSVPDLHNQQNNHLHHNQQNNNHNHHNHLHHQQSHNNHHHEDNNGGQSHSAGASGMLGLGGRMALRQHQR
uniref:Uncharacterized protein n=1 Tax=Megaselia scalaris TaxID=36166 RepID=T1GYK1_MEGSC